jgi:YesN/AraC family two-component response regulator
MRILEVFPSIVKNVEVSHKQGSKGEKYFMHIHSHYEIYFSQSNNNKFFVDNKIYDVQKNDLFLFNNTDAHKIATSSIEDYDRYVVNFSPKVVTKYNQSLAFLLDCFSNSTSSRRHKLSLSDTEAQTFLSIVNKMIDINSNDTPHRDIKIALLLLELLLFINECFDTKSHHEIETNEDPRLNEMMKFIQENCNYAISLDMLSSKFSFNKYYLCHIFKAKMGFGISEYIKSCRLAKAIPLLREGMSVSDVALKTGFGSDTYFISTFKKNFGTSPKQYLKKL